MTKQHRVERGASGRRADGAAPAGSEKRHSGDLTAPLTAVVEAIDEHKGADLLVIDLRDIASFTDSLVICSARSERHAQALVDAIVERLKEDGVSPLHTEGYEQGRWVLVDYVDFVVNVFTPETRDFYQLERVWRDAPVLAGERLHGLERDGQEDGAGEAEGDEEAGR